MQQRSKWAILSGVILAMLLSSLDQTIVSTAMPTIVQELHGLEHFSWVFTAYMLGSTVTVPIYGKLSDLFGRRKLYLIGICIFLAGSILCGLAGDMTQLILFRAIQGIGGGAMMVNSFAIIGEVFPPAERGRYQGMIGGVFGLSSVAGPLLGGWITDHTSWRWVFYVNIPLGILALIVLSTALPKLAKVAKDRRIDWWGAFFILATLIPLLLSLVWGGSVYQWSSLPIITALLISGASLIAFIFTERRVVNPILSPDLFRSRVFVVAVACLFFTSMGMYGAILYVPIFSQGVIGGSATHAGMVLTPLMLSLVIASTISGQVISRTGRYKALAVTGIIVIVAGLFYFSTLRADTSNAGLIARMIVLGAGLGTTMPVFTLAVQSAFSTSRLGEVTAGSQLFRNVGGTVGTAILGGIMNSSLAGEMRSLQDQPIVATLQKNAGLASDGSFIQSILNADEQSLVRSRLAELPPAQSSSSLRELDALIASSKAAFTNAVDNVFLVAAILMTVALILVFFLPEIPLRSSEKPALQKTGELLKDELAQRSTGEDDERVAASARRAAR